MYKDGGPTEPYGKAKPGCVGACGPGGQPPIGQPNAAAPRPARGAARTAAEARTPPR